MLDYLWQSCPWLSTGHQYLSHYETIKISTLSGRTGLESRQLPRPFHVNLFLLRKADPCDDCCWFGDNKTEIHINQTAKSAIYLFNVIGAKHRYIGSESCFGLVLTLNPSGEDWLKKSKQDKHSQFRVSVWKSDCTKNPWWSIFTTSRVKSEPESTQGIKSLGKAWTEIK